MPLASFTSPSDVRLITFRGNIFKIKVISYDIQPFHEEFFSTEVEEVMRAFLHIKNRNKLKKVQTERFLFTIHTLPWRAAELLKFTATRRVYSAYPKQVQFTVRPKKRRETEPRKDQEQVQGTVRPKKRRETEPRKDQEQVQGTVRPKKPRETKPREDTKQVQATVGRKKPRETESISDEVELIVRPHEQTGTTTARDAGVTQKRKSPTYSEIPKKKFKIADSSERPLHFLTVDLGRPVDIELYQSSGSGHNHRRVHDQDYRDETLKGGETGRCGTGSQQIDSHGSHSESNTRSSSRVNDPKSSWSHVNGHNQRVEDVSDFDAYSGSTDVNSNSNNSNVTIRKNSRQMRQVKARRNHCLDSHTELCEREKRTKTREHPMKTRNVQSYTRDRVLIQQEDLAEEMKLQELSTPVVNQPRLSQEHKASMLRTAMEVFLNPVKLLFNHK